MEDLLNLGGRSIRSRLLIGTGKFSSYPVMQKALVAAVPDIVTVALRRVDLGSSCSLDEYRRGDSHAGYRGCRR